MVKRKFQNGSELICSIHEGDSVQEGDTVVIKTADGSECLHINFQRGIRWADDESGRKPLSSYTRYPLTPVATHAARLPKEMVDKGGFMFSMYQREAMWINFESTGNFAVKVHLGGTNAISGEPALETPVVKNRRANLFRDGKLVQDYIVAPYQQWLDGICHAPGDARQIVAPPLGSDLSIETQGTSQDFMGGIQFDVWRMSGPLGHDDNVPIYVRNFKGKTMCVSTKLTATVGEVMEKIEEMDGMPKLCQRFVYGGKQLSMFQRLVDYNVRECCTLWMAVDPRFIMYVRQEHLTTLRAGGRIAQGIARDMLPSDKWDREHSASFNLHILNTAQWQEVTGKRAPPGTVDYDMYQELRIPFSKFSHEPLYIKKKLEDAMLASHEESEQGSDQGANASQDVKADQVVNPLVTSFQAFVPLRPVSDFRPLDELEREVKTLGTQKTSETTGPKTRKDPTSK